jgi:hypothetical protein
MFILIAGVYSCEKYSYLPPVINTVDTLHFGTDIQPIFTGKCITCHGSITKPDLREGKAYISLTKGNYVDTPGETSKLYAKMISSGHEPKSSAADKQKVLIWINQGAKNN